MKNAYFINRVWLFHEITRAKETPNLCGVMCYTFWISKQFAKLKGKNGMQKKKIQNKRKQIKLTSNVEITLNANC